MVSILSFIAVLGIIVFVHELGHFLAAKSVGIRVETFSLGFPPKMVGKKWGETEYMISWLPLGGYVKMAGMIDESFDDKPLTGASWEFMSKNFWQKSFAIVAGVVMNFILAFIIYTILTMASGIGEIGPAEIGGVEPGMPAETAGIIAGDLVTEVNGENIEDWEALAAAIHALPDQDLELTWVRGEETFNALLRTEAFETIIDGQKVEIGLVGISPQLTMHSAGLIESVRNGAEMTAFITGISFVSLKMLVTGQATIKDIVGPVGIVHYSGESARSGVATFFSFIALISINIGFLNLLPIPALDGGHLVYIIIEAVIRRPISTKVKLVVQQAGMAALLLLMLVISYNDIMKFFIK